MLKQINKTYCCVGLMSGTSLDGLDIVLCNLSINDGKWTYSFLKTQTIDYPVLWKERLQTAMDLKGYHLLKLHREYGTWLGEQVKLFLEDEKSVPDLIASHGHTIFHEPDNKFNFQLGDGASLAAAAGITTVSDFRSLDICMEGQGAPLVPVGDELLFNQYAACVNLGGFANVSCRQDGARVAWDICAVNFILNRLASRVGLNYDRNGELGQKGKILKELKSELDNLTYYTKVCPKSLGQEWVEKDVWPIIVKYLNEPIEDVLYTYYKHAARVIANDLKTVHKGAVLFTGGGVHNTFLMSLIASQLHLEVVIPDKSVADYKEALIFCLLGALRFDNQINCLASVTGARENTSSGVINKI